MRKILPESIEVLTEEFAKLPGIGPKSASRLVFYLLSKPQTDLDFFAAALANLKKTLSICKKCFNISENQDLCVICQDSSRDQKQICIVETLLDVLALEKTHKYRGLYHVLGGVISPIEGIGPDELNIKPLFSRLKAKNTSEIIIATNPDLEGDATAMFLLKELKKLDHIKITRLAFGLPMGGNLEYADEITLERALEGRREYNN